jgi:hypothetical protein
VKSLPMALALTASYPGRRAGHNRDSEMTGFRVCHAIYVKRRLVSSPSYSREHQEQASPTSSHVKKHITSIIGTDSSECLCSEIRARVTPPARSHSVSLTTLGIRSRAVPSCRCVYYDWSSIRSITQVDEMAMRSSCKKRLRYNQEIDFAHRSRNETTPMRLIREYTI